MYEINTHIGEVLTPTEEDDSVWGALEESLDETTKPYETLFNRTLKTEELKSDNETFAIALMDVLDVNGQAGVIIKFGIPTQVGDWTVVKLMASAAMAGTANSMNLSLRQEFTRAFLDKALVETGVTEARQTLGSWLSKAFKGVKDLFGKVVTNVVDFFKNLGKEVGTGLRKFGDWVNRMTEIIYKNVPFLGMLGEMLLFTPGFKFIFGSFFREVGLGWETGEDVNWKKIAADGSVYLAQMSMKLKIASAFLPPPYNIIAKLVSVVFKASSSMINQALMEKMKAVFAEATREQAIAREAFEKALYEEVYAAYDIPLPPMQPSLYGSTGSNKSGEPIKIEHVAFIGLAGIIGLRLLGVF